MRLTNLAHGLLTAVFVAVLPFSGGQSASVQAATSGWFTVVWGDGRSGSTAQTSSYLLTEDSGQTTSLSMDEALAAPFGGVLALDRQRISVTGVRELSATADGSQPTLRVDTIALEKPTGTMNAQDVGAQAVAGSQPFLSIMCKFKDINTEPKSLTYFQNMYSNVHPGLDDYWREVSYAMANIAGSTAVGWYTLPQPRSYYVHDQDGDGHPDLDFSRSATDCTQQANLAGMNFAPFKGINLMFNAIFDSANDFAWGGSQCMTLDTVSKCWPMTWEPPWGYSNITVISHEMGHAFGLPHSSGTYGQTYDNRWDMMSDSWTDCSRATDPTYGCLGQGTISYHKDKLGWIPAGQKYTATGDATITLEQLDVPQTSNYLMAQIPINGSSTNFYTVEVRRQASYSYDVKLPAPPSGPPMAVIIHNVNVTRLNPANVIDADGNGNTGDVGAMWTVGETFSDTAHGISVQVLSATASGFQVQIHVAPVQTTTVFRSLGPNDGWILESTESSNKGGAMNSAATTFFLGDNAANKQYKAVLHFDTSSLPDNADISKVTLKIMKQGLVGTNPFSAYGALRADIRTPYFGTSAALQIADFQATASAAALFSPKPAGNWYSAVLSNTAKDLVNRTGATQFRLHFTLDDNNDHGADYMLFYSGNVTTVANRPQLIVQYSVP